jgi:hypothetical protein
LADLAEESQHGLNRGFIGLKDFADEAHFSLIRVNPEISEILVSKVLFLKP